VSTTVGDVQDIVVGVDRSETAKRAAIRAAELAAKLGANLHVVTGVDRKHATSVKVGNEEVRSDPLMDADQMLRDVARTLPHDSISVAAVVGDPASAICDEAARLDAQVIVVGNRRVQGVTRVLGSVALDVVRHAPCDVFIVNTAD
jgi:nucleotide-binding universal stress UspA family protein